MVAAAELNIDTAATAMQMANAMFGSGVTVTSASYTGAAASSGIYSGGLTTSPGVVPSDGGVILSTGQAQTFTNSTGNGNQFANASGNMGTAGDSQLTAIAGFNTYDAAILEATFVPVGDTLTMQIVFSSEEYLEYVGSNFNDACAIWVNGVQAELTVGTGDITINNVNTTSNSNLYVDNRSSTSPYNTEMDGFTITLTLKAPVIANQTNTIKIGIADAGDRIYDSNLLVIGDSVQVALIAEDDCIEVSRWGTADYDLRTNDTSSTNSTLTVTHINGQPVVAGSTIVLATGEEITLNADGTITVAPNDELGENTLSYTVQDALGNTDVAFITIKTVPCFVAGTRILTARGELPVEQLCVGDRVITRDHGLQPVRWVGGTQVPAVGAMAPVRIEANKFGMHDAIEVSQQHRILVRGTHLDMAFGVSEALVKARHLVDGDSVRICESDDEVSYFHVLFDQHEVIWSNGLCTESFHPGEHVLGEMDQDARDEILSLFPQLDPQTGAGYGPAARIDLKPHEVCSLLNV